jgi:pimeloyl-ACP methyl ester carboxylesterase
VICVNGGRSKRVEGTWSASLEWLVDRLAPQFPSLRFAEVRYRVKSWQQLDWCIEDAHEAIAAVAAPRTLMLGFSMGGAVSAAVAGEPTVVGVLGLAPWLPDRLSLAGLRGKRFRVVHGRLDRACLVGRRGAPAAGSSVRFQPAPTASTRSSPVRCTASRCGLRGGRRCHFLARGAGCTCAPTSSPVSLPDPHASSRNSADIVPVSERTLSVRASRGYEGGTSSTSDRSRP